MIFEHFKLEKGLVVQEKRGNLEEHELHHHDVLEYHILLENEARFQLPHKQYEGKPGDVFLFRPFEPHWNLVKHPDKPIRWISILFTPAIVRFLPHGYKLLAPFYAVEAVSPHIPAASPAAQAIHRLAAQALAEERRQLIGWEAKQMILFADILVHTLRHAADCRESPEPAARTNNRSRLSGNEALDDGIIQSIEYILAHFTDEMDIDAFIRTTGRQRTFFYRKFKAVTGLTPNLFMHRLRMQVAIHLLVHTDKSVTDIAFECGYATLQYFIHHFKSYSGLSPLKYRKRMV